MRVFVFSVGSFLAMLAGLAGGMLALIAMHRVHGEYMDEGNGIKIHYTVEGEGQPLILVHGYGANADLNWRIPGITAELAKSFKVIAMDDRGHGLSSKPTDPNQYGIEMVNDVIRLMDHLKIEKAHVVGYSMGGFITLKLLAEHPDRLLSAAPCGAGWADPDSRSTKFLEELSSSVASNHDFTPLTKMLTPQGMKVNTLQLEISNFAMTQLNDPAALAAAIKNFKDLAVTREQLNANKIPTLTIVGGADALRREAEALKEAMPSLELVVVDGGTHTSVIFRREFLDALKAFLAKQAQ